MILKLILTSLAATIVLLGSYADLRADELDALFDSNSTLEVTITAALKQIMDERPEKEYVAGTIDAISNDGSTLKLDVGIRTRGEFRRRIDICPFAPLRVNLRKKQVDGTIFEEQDKLKLVTHCRNDSERYDQTVVAEYLAYRILNLMTDSSFRARLMRVNYVYTDDDEAVTAYAFFIEHKNQLAKRLQLSAIELERIGVSQVQPEHGNLVSVFHYLIGNTDFSPVSGHAGEFCCHNHVLFRADESQFLSIPYDFDQSGFVNAPHGVTNPRFNLRSPKHRLYRGRCINLQILPDTLAKYRAKRPDIEALINNQEELSNGTRKSIMRVVEDFYKIIDSEKRTDSLMAKACI